MKMESVYADDGLLLDKVNLKLERKCIRVLKMMLTWRK